MAAPQSGLEAVELAVLMTTTVRQVYPTLPGLTTGLQGSIAGDMQYQDLDESFVQQFMQPAAARSLGQPGPKPGPAAGPTGGQNPQRT
jgi:hypothetical protein